ncbi:MAG: cupin domain-containing protein [Thermoleophilia bacterium]
MQRSPFDPIHLGPITVTFSVDAEASNGSVTVARCDVAEGAGVPVAHSHDGFEETIHGLAGTVTFTLDGTPVDIGPGDTVCIRRGVVHSFLAKGGATSFLAIATPGLFGPEYFHDVAELLAAAGGGPPEPAAVAAVMARHGLTLAPQPVAS